MMKRFIITLALCSICLWACEEKVAPEAYSIEASSDRVEANKLGLDKIGNALTFTVTSNVFWEAKTDADWITFSPKAGFGEEVAINLELAPNKSSSRSAELVFEAIDGTKAVVTVSEEGQDESLEFMRLSFENSHAAYEGVGAAPARLFNEGASVVGDALFFDMDTVVYVGPIQHHGCVSFSVDVETSGGAAELFVSNETTPKYQITGKEFHFDQPTNFYLGVRAKSGTRMKGITVNEAPAGAGQEVAFGDGKPVGHVYYQDNFSWLVRLAKEDYITSLVGDNEIIWGNLSEEIGFNPYGWSLSDNPLKQRVYCHKGYLKFGRKANSQGSGGGVMTPKMRIPAGKLANAQVTFRAFAFLVGTSAFDAESALMVRIVGSGEFKENGSNTITIALDTSLAKKDFWTSTTPEYRNAHLDEAWETYSVTVEGMSSDTRLVFETAVETTNGRAYFGGATVTKIAD